jgi:transcriptional regulator with XRE-family HTH domain
MPATPTGDLLERLKDPEYAKLYGEENAKVDFAITLTKARKSLNFTQRSLAEKLGISQPYVAKLEGGEANPTLGTVGRLLAAINLRLVTATAPLNPEPLRPFQGFVWVSAPDANNEALPCTAYNENQRNFLASSGYSAVDVNIAAIPSTILPSSAKDEPREIIVGGAAR